MNSNQIRALSDSELLVRVKDSVTEERKHTAMVLEYLREIDRRRLYADSGYPSLWEFCTKELGYSEASASRRISSMRLLRDLPELKADLLSGKQNLSSLAQAQRFFRIEEKHREARLSFAQKQYVLDQLAGKSTRECEKELLKLSSAPLEIMKPEQERCLDETHTELRLVLDSDLLNKLKRIQALRSHAQSSMSYADLLEFMANEVLKRLDPLEKEKEKERESGKGKVLKTESLRDSELESQPPAPEVKSKVKRRSGVPNSKSRVPIPARIRRLVWLRDQGKCGFVNSETAHACGSRHFLELDHIRPVALGGDNSPENLRLRCRAHNQRASVRIFGVKRE
jgi:hypothetical protein